MSFIKYLAMTVMRPTWDKRRDSWKL